MPVARLEDGVDPQHEALVADSVAPALLVVLETLDPAERPAFVLHHMFAVPFDADGSLTEVLGAPAVAETFSGRARATKLAQVDGSPGLVWSQGGRALVVFGFTITEGKIVAIDVLADARVIDTLDLQVIEARRLPAITTTDTFTRSSGPPRGGGTRSRSTAAASTGGSSSCVH